MIEGIAERLEQSKREESENWNAFRNAFSASLGGKGGRVFDQLIAKDNFLRNLCLVRSNILKELIYNGPSSPKELAWMRGYLVEKRDSVLADFRAQLEKAKGKKVYVFGHETQAGYDDNFGKLAMVRVGIIFNKAIGDVDWYSKQRGWSV